MVVVVMEGAGETAFSGSHCIRLRPSLDAAQSPQFLLAGIHNRDIIFLPVSEISRSFLGICTTLVR
jgi:hypothetical protein